MRNTFAKFLLREAKKDDSILLITGDLGFGVLDDFQKERPGQFINAGVAEQSMMSLSAGLASQGYRPFVYSIANFPTFRCLEQIRNDVCYMNNPVTIVSVGAGLSYGVHGYTHHAVEDVSIIRALPNMSLYSPSDQSETEYCLQSILSARKPSYLRLGKGGESNLQNGLQRQISDATVYQHGRDGVLCWTGAIGANVVKAAELLKNWNVIPTLISVPVLSANSLRQVLTTAAGSPILSIEEHVLPGGLGSWLLEIAADQRYLGLIDRLGLTDQVNSQIGSQAYLIEKANLDPNSIADKFISLKDFSHVMNSHHLNAEEN